MTGPSLCPAVSSQFRDTRVMVRDHDTQHAVVVDHGLMPVQARLMPGVVDRLPPRVPERVAPVETLRRLDLDDERFIEPSWNEPITGRFSAAAPIAVPSNGGLNVFGCSAARTGGRSRGSPRRSHPTRQAGRHHRGSRVDRRPTRRTAPAPESRSIDSDAQPQCPSRRRSGGRRVGSRRSAICIQFPACSSADRMISKSPLAARSISSSKTFAVLAMPAIVCSPTYRAVPRFPHSRYVSAAPQAGTHVDAVRAVHAPLEHGVGVRRPDREHCAESAPQTRRRCRSTASTRRWRKPAAMSTGFRGHRVREHRRRGGPAAWPAGAPTPRPDSRSGGGRVTSPGRLPQRRRHPRWAHETGHGRTSKRPISQQSASQRFTRR